MSSISPDLDRAGFGEDFTWGVAHASYQVEGAWDRDGKGPSIWDTFTHERRRRIRDRSNGDRACEFYDRYEDDTQLVAELGFGAQRFSISWPRVLPEGTGRVNRAGLDFYSRVVDACLERGIEPWVTLYHWDLPEALQQRGGWANRDIVGWFEEYVGTVADHLGDRVRNWMVFNEPGSFVPGGYLAGIHAPGVRNPLRFLAAAHHVNLCQSVGAAAIRARTTDSNVGTTHLITPFRTADGTARQLKAARALDAFGNRIHLEPNFGLGYPIEDAPLMARIERFVRNGDESAVVVDWDFIGVQYYCRVLARPAPIPGLYGFPWMSKDHRRFEVSAMGQEIQPDGLHEALSMVHAYEKVPTLIVTENGVCVPDQLDGDRVRDHRRVGFFRDHLAQVARAIEDGLPVEGYFVWSLTDNFEWAEGYTARFGLAYTDYATQRRIVKDSGRWFQGFLTS